MCNCENGGLLSVGGEMKHPVVVVSFGENEITWRMVDAGGTRSRFPYLVGVQSNRAFKRQMEEFKVKENEMYGLKQVETRVVDRKRTGIRITRQKDRLYHVSFLEHYSQLIFVDCPEVFV